MGAQWKAKGKAAAADARGKLFGRLAKDIMIAARNGADPAANSRLRLVVEQARKVSMPKDTLDRAIKKGAGLTGETVHFEQVIYEGFAPHRVPVMVEVLTDNTNRAASDMRVLFRKGQQGTPGSVSWDFDHVGLIDVVDQWFGGPCDDPDVVEEVAFRHGLIAAADLRARCSSSSAAAGFFSEICVATCPSKAAGPAPRNSRCFVSSTRRFRRSLAVSSAGRRRAFLASAPAPATTLLISVSATV